VFVAPAKIEILGKNHVVFNKGETIRIPCQITGGIPQGFVRWIREDGKVMPGSGKSARQ